jgi:type I restriction enzyme R subunit
MCDFETSEKHLSQIPALQLLINLGFEFLTPSEAFKERQGRYSNVLLENILRNQLKEINRIRHKAASISSARRMCSPPSRS